MEAHRKSCFETLRHKNACSIDELKSRLRKVQSEMSARFFFFGMYFFHLVVFFVLGLQLYVQDMKVKRDKILKDKRDILILDEDDVDFFKRYCREFFGRNEDPVDLDEDLLNEIWEEIKLKGIICHDFIFPNVMIILNVCFLFFIRD